MQSGLDWLFSLADQERGVGWNPRASADEQWKLGRTRALLDLVGAPDRHMTIVLVAGTKGKGSTCAMLASILSAAGLRCGLYTKPHLQAYRERVRVDGRAISEAELEEATGRMRRAADGLPAEAGEPTTFEVTTALALDEFHRQGCSVAVVEVGLGGRLDATNATDPTLSVIASISYDHTAILGRTLGQIATEKAGILRPGRVALLAEQRPAAMAALRRVCERVGAACQVVAPLEAPVPLLGQHQQQNAALAIAAARQIAPISEEAIARGLRQLHWPGRFEVVRGDPTLVLDGAHNGASAEALATTLVDFAGTRPISVVIGINRDKDASAVLRPLLEVATHVWVTQTHDNVRALDAPALGRRARRMHQAVTVEPDLRRALDDARAATRGAGVLCVTGSLMLVGQTRDVLGLPPPECLW
jgi:dihydrofolate synthase/folylpolyglutamate synthase